MRTINEFLDESISNESIALIDQLFYSDLSIFSQQAELLGLNKQEDFKNSNLQGVTFDESDLRGFDFTGADLQGAVGRNVTWDKTTIIKGANIAGSIFAYEADRDEFFSYNISSYDVFLRKQKEHWASNINWFADRLSRPTPNREEIVEIAKATCDTTKDSFLRSQLLLFMSSAFDSKTKHRDFLIHTLARHGNDVTTARSAIRTMATLYNHDEIVFDLLKKEMNNSDYSIREAAVRGIITSKTFRRKFSDIAVAVMHFNSDVRRFYVYHAAASLGAPYVKAVAEPTGNAAIDFVEAISSKKLERMAYAMLLSEATRLNAGRRTSQGEIAIPNINEKQISSTSNDIRRLLETMKKFGVPFKFE